METIEEAQKAPVVSVVIPHLNDLAHLKICCARLREQSWPADRMEIVVADNNPAWGLAPVTLVEPGITVVPALERGAGQARNVGVAASRGSVLAFIDSDCVPEPDWIAHGIKGLTTHDFVGGNVVTFIRERDNPTSVEAFEQVFGFDFARYISKLGFTGTGNMFVSRTVFERVGGFRAAVSEDVEWSFRARSLGFSLGYVPDAVVGHPARTNWRDLRARWARMLAEDYGLVHAHRFGRTLFVCKALAMPLSLVPHTCRILRSPRLTNARARAGAIGVLIRLRLWRLTEMIRLAAANQTP
ncbi:MAG: glycosyltransferase [Acetobacteraceae bacterium]